MSAAEIETLSAHGERRFVDPGEVLLREGEPSTYFYVLLEGLAGVFEDYHGRRRLIRVHGPRRFLGELSILTGQVEFVTTVALNAGEVLAIPADRLRGLALRQPELGDLILRACLIRRSLLIGSGAGFRIVGSRSSPDTQRLRSFAARNRLPHRFVDIESDAVAESLIRQLGVTPDALPIVLVRNHEVLRNPSNAELAEAAGLRAHGPQEEVVDLIVVGAGPSGLAAAVYGASEGLSTVVLDAIATGGQAGTSSRIENYLGFPAGISGAELAERAAIQARKFGARITIPSEARQLHRSNGHIPGSHRDGRRGHSTVRDHRHRRAVPEARRASARRVRDDERVLRGHAIRGTGVRVAFSRRGRRWQLRGPGHGLPRANHIARLSRDPRRRPTPTHVLSTSSTRSTHSPNVEALVLLLHRGLGSCVGDHTI